MSTKDFNKLQMNEIDRFKWLESEKAGYDLGAEAVLRWVVLYAKKFREEFYKPNTGEE